MKRAWLGHRTAGLLLAALLLGTPVFAQNPSATRRRPAESGGGGGGLTALRIEGIRLSHTSGTMLLQELSARSAAFSDSGAVLESEDLSVRIEPHDGTTPRLRATAPRGLLVLTGMEPPKLKLLAANANPPSLEVLQALAAFEPNTRRRGDLRLTDRPEFSAGRAQFPVRIELEERGRIEAEEIVWSRELGGFVSPRLFRQDFQTPDGTRIVVDGAAFVVDERFQQFIYFATESKSVRFQIGAEQNPR